METIWIEAVEQFLQGEQWKQQVVAYVDEHSRLFSRVGEQEDDFTHEQYASWHGFKDLVDECIGGVVCDLGGSEELFANACEEKLKQPDLGPRDAAVKDVLRKLMAYDTFEEFSTMMRLRCEELEGNVPCDADYLKRGDTEECADKPPSGRSVDDILSELSAQKSKCRRTQFRLSGTLMNKLYYLVKETNGNPSSKDIVQVFENDETGADMSALLANPNQVTVLVQNLQKLQELEDELNVAYNSGGNVWRSDVGGSTKKIARIKAPSLSAQQDSSTDVDPDLQEAMEKSRTHAALAAQKEDEFSTALSRSKADYDAATRAEEDARRREEEEFQRALELSLLESERMKTNMMRQGLWELTSDMRKMSPVQSQRKSVAGTDELLLSLRHDEEEFKQHAMAAKDAIAKTEMREAQLQLEKAELEEKFIAEKLAREQGTRTYKEEGMRLQSALEKSERERAELEEALKQVQSDLEGKVSDTADASRKKEAELLRHIEEATKRSQEMAEEMEQRILNEQKLLDHARLEARNKEESAQHHMKRSSELQLQLEEESRKRRELEEALAAVHVQIESKVSETAEKARQKEQELLEELTASNRRAEETAVEMEKRAAEERAAHGEEISEVRAEARQKAEKAAENEKQIQTLSEQLNEEARKRAQLEEAVRQLAVESESKVSSTAEAAKEKEIHLLRQIDETKEHAKRMAEEMDRRLKEQRAALEEAQRETMKSHWAVEHHEKRSTELEKRLAKQEEKRMDLEAALRALEAESKDKVSSASKHAKQKEAELLKQLEDTNCRAEGMARELEEQIRSERLAAEAARAEAERKGLLVKTQEEQSYILQKQLQEEEHRRKELEQALEEAKVATESKVSETAEAAKEKQAELESELAKLKKSAGKRNKRMHQLLEALRNEEGRVKELAGNLDELRQHYEDKASMADEVSKELSKKETAFILEMQQARRKTEDIRKEMGAQLERQRESALRAMETAKRRSEEADAHKSTAKELGDQLEMERQKRLEMEKLLEDQKAQSESRMSEAEKLKAELSRKEAQLKNENAKREALLLRLLEFEKGQSALASKHAALAQRHANTLGGMAAMAPRPKRTSNYEEVLHITGNAEAASAKLNESLRDKQDRQREKIRCRLEMKKKLFEQRNQSGGRKGMGEVREIQVAGMNVVDFTSDDDDF